MRHRLKGRKLGRTTSHRKAMTKNMVTNLFIHGRVITTLQKAKEMRRYAEHLITLGKKGGLAAFRAILDVVRDPLIAKKIVNDVAKRYPTRPGGYTRVIKLGGCRWDGDGHGLYAWNRLGDNGQRAIWELIDRKEPEEEMRLAGRGKLAVTAEDKKKAPKAPKPPKEKKPASAEKAKAK